MSFISLKRRKKNFDSPHGSRVVMTYHTLTTHLRLFCFIFYQTTYWRVRKVRTYERVLWREKSFVFE